LEEISAWAPISTHAGLSLVVIRTTPAAIRMLANDRDIIFFIEMEFKE
jgi:hypothetical protein